MRLTSDQFALAVEDALAEVPPALEELLENVTVDVSPMPSEAECKSVGIDDPRHLLGLYHGIPLTRRSVEHHGQMPDRITIYQRNIERHCRTLHDLKAQIRKTVLHEVGHHFGLSESDLDDLGYG